MKNVKKVITLLVFVLGVVNLCTAQADNITKKLEGEWSFSAPDAPYGYNEGKVLISKKDGKLDASVKMNSGSEISLKKINAKANKISFESYVDYQYITIDLELKNNILKGKVNSDDGDFLVTIKKRK